MTLKSWKNTEKPLSIGINGTSSGLGQYLCEELLKNANVVRVKEKLPQYEAIIKELDSCDVFINNVHKEYFQVELFTKLYEKWREEDRLIISIGSRAVNQNASPNYQYASAKIALQSAVDNVIINDKNRVCRLSVINPGLIEKIPDCSLKYSDVLDAVIYTINLQSSIEITRLDLNHRKPYPIVQSIKRELYKQGGLNEA